MRSRLLGREPDPFASPVRAFFDGRTMPYANLTELRAAMVEDDKRLIGFIGSRVMEDYWIDPVVDLAESARNKVGRLAVCARPRHEGFPQLVEAVYGVLAPEVSPLIDDIDQAIVSTIAARTKKAMLATAFKLDRGEGIAPAQQTKNQARAVEIAENPLYAIHPSYGDFSAIVNDVYGVLVPGTANKLQQAMFPETYLLHPHYAGRDDWDASMTRSLGHLVPQHS